MRRYVRGQVRQTYEDLTRRPLGRFAWRWLVGVTARDPATVEASSPVNENGIGDTVSSIWSLGRFVAERVVLVVGATALATERRVFLVVLTGVVARC